MRTTANPRRGTRRVHTGLALAGVLLAVTLLGTGGALLLSGGGRGADPGTIGGPFALTDGAGRQVTDRDFRGKYLLVYFGYTACPDACPTTLNEIADAMGRLGPDAARVQPIFVTLDPARDTPAVVRDYAAAFGPNIVGLTGTQAQVDQVASEYRVFHAVHRTGPGPGTTRWTIARWFTSWVPAGGCWRRSAPTKQARPWQPTPATSPNVDRPA